MKAWTLQEIGKIELVEREIPKPKKGEVLVKVMAAGVCGSDIPRIYRDGAHRMPLILGHEFAGQVVELGEDVEEKWLKKPVGIFPLIPCRSCGPCMKKQYEMCRNYNYLGSRCDGGFAEYAVVPADNLIELPEGVSFEQAAMLEPMAVAVHAMRRVKPDKDDAIVVWGLGTIGLLLLMFLKAEGFEQVYVIGNKEWQRKSVEKLGINVDDYCDCNAENVKDWILQKTNGNGADVFFECVGKKETIVQAIENTIPGGKIQLVGNPYSDMMLEKPVYWKILRNQLTLKGTWNSSFTGEEEDDWHYVISMLAAGKIHPEKLISHLLKMEDLEHGFHIMRDKSEDYVKVMMKE